MVSREEYNQYIKKLVNQSQDNNIKSLSMWYKIISIFVLVIGVVVCLCSFPFIVINDNLLVCFFIGVCLIIVSIVMFRVRNKSLKYYRGDIRDKLVNYLLKGNIYRFDKTGWLSSIEFDNSQFSDKYDCFSSSDLLEINIPNDDGSESKIDFQIGDVNAYNVDVDEEGRRTTTDVYRGMFGYVKFYRSFKCILTVNSKFKRKGVKLDKVVLEDIDFNKKIKVTTNNQIEARYILTPKMMEKIEHLESKIEGIKIVFVDKCLYIGSEDVNMFELGRYKNNDETSVFENLYDEIELILGIVNEIKNNDKVFKM